MALKLNMEWREREGREPKLPRPTGSSVVELGGWLPARVIVTARSLLVAGRLLGGRWIEMSIALPKAVAAEQEDLGVLDETIGDDRGDGGVVEDVSPVGEGSVRGDNGGAFVTVAGGDHLIEQIGALLVER